MTVSLFQSHESRNSEAIYYSYRVRQWSECVLVGDRALTVEEERQRYGTGWQGRKWWNWTGVGGNRMTSWFLIYILFKNVNVIHDKERLRYFSRLKDTKGTWYLNAIYNLRWDHGQKKKYKECGVFLKSGHMDWRINKSR